MAAEGANRQPMARNQIGIAVLALVVLIAVGLGLYFLLHKSSTTKKTTAPTGKYKPVTARILSANGLTSESLLLGQQFFWAGPKPNYGYEFRRTADGYIYVRYLPNGVHAGAAGDYLVISTYPFTQAVNGLKNQAQKAGATAIEGRGGSYFYVDQKRPRTVYMAFPGINAQVEIFGQSPIDAVTLARSGKIRLAQ